MLYFADDPLHGDVVFQRCLSMNRKLFMVIVLAVREFAIYCVCKEDCVSTIVLSAI
jgi:hypothetical protein